MNMEVNEINYKKIYNVAECAGITNFDMTDGANRLDVYTKIKNWINSDNELKNLFTAEVVTLNESNQYYCVRLKTSTGFFAAYGSTGGNSHTAVHYGYYTSGGNNYSAFSSVTGCDVDRLKFMTVKGDYGFAFGFYSATMLPDTQIRGIITTCTDDTGNEIELGIHISGYGLTFIKNSYTYTSSNYFLFLPSTSSITALSSFLIPSMDLLSENCRIADGHQFSGLTCFEAGGKKWCLISQSTSYKGLALLLED